MKNICKHSFWLDVVFLHKLIVASFDVCVLLLVFNLSYSIRNSIFYWRGGVYVAGSGHILMFLVLMGIILWLFRQHKLYQPVAFKPSAEHLEVLTAAWIKFTALFILVSFAFRIKLFIDHRITTGLFFCLGWLGLYVTRFQLVPRIAMRLLSRESLAHLAIVVGRDKKMLLDTERYLSQRPYCAKLLGLVDEQGKPGEMYQNTKVLGNIEQLPEIIRTYGIAEVFIRLPQERFPDLAMLLGQLQGLNCQVRVAIEHFELIQKKIPLLTEMAEGFLSFHTSRFIAIDRLLKRVLDMVVSFLGLLICSPLFLILSVLIKCSSKGPTFFCQTRMGLNGTSFKMFKFRTMRSNTEAHHQKAVAALMKGEGAFFEDASKNNLLKSTDSSEVTWIGRLLRKYSIDELPQLINVLRGEMSLVGPRPEPLYQVAAYKKWHHARLAARPGITGFWQVYGRSSVSHNDMVLMDVFYINNWSFALDMKILIHTLFVVLTGKGAL